MRDRVSVEGSATDQRGTTVTMRLKDGRQLQQRVDSTVPESDYDLQWQRLTTKFLGLAMPVIGDEAAQQLLGMVRDLDDVRSMRDVARVTTPLSWAPAMTDAFDPASFPLVKHGNQFQDFAVGQVWTHHWGRTFTAADNVIFSTATCHWSPMHLNVEFARAHGHPDVVVNPMLVLCTVVGLSVEDLSEVGGPFLGVERMHVPRARVSGRHDHRPRRVVDEMRRAASRASRHRHLAHGAQNQRASSSSTTGARTWSRWRKEELQ